MYVLRSQVKIMMHLSIQVYFKWNCESTSVYVTLYVSKNDARLFALLCFALYHRTLEILLGMQEIIYISSLRTLSSAGCCCYCCCHLSTKYFNWILFTHWMYPWQYKMTHKHCALPKLFKMQYWSYTNGCLCTIHYVCKQITFDCMEKVETNAKMRQQSMFLIQQ